jgi:hypothetical protein
LKRDKLLDRMRGKYKHKKQAQQAQPRPDLATVPPAIDQTISAKPTRATERQNKKDNPVRFIKLIKDDPKFRVEVIAVVVGAAVLIVYAFQLRAMRDAIEQTQRNFESDQAPVVWVTPQPPVVEVGKRLTWNIPFANYGRSPARNVRHCARLAMGPMGLNALQSLPTPSADFCDNQPFRSVSVIPQGAPGNYVSGLSPDPLKPEDVEIITKLDGGAIVYGVISYEDAVGHGYESTFCYYRLITGAIMSCEKYNSIQQTK